MHKKNKHGTSQTGSGALLSDQTIPHHVSQEILHIDDIPNKDETSMYSEKN